MPRPIPPEPPVTSTRWPASSRASDVPVDIAVVHTANRELADTLVRGPQRGQQRLGVAAYERQRGSEIPPAPGDHLRDESRRHLEHARRQDALTDARRRRQWRIERDDDQVWRL